MFLTPKVWKYILSRLSAPPSHRINRNRWNMYYAAEKNRIILFKRVRYPSVSGSAGKKDTDKFASFHLRYKRLIPCNHFDFNLGHGLDISSRIDGWSCPTILRLNLNPGISHGNTVSFGFGERLETSVNEKKNNMAAAVEGTPRRVRALLSSFLHSSDKNGKARYA